VHGWDLGDLLRARTGASGSLSGTAPDWHSGDLGRDTYRSYPDSVDAVLAALADDAVLTRPATVREFGTFPGRVAVSMRLVDSVAHGWEIARALGMPYEPDPHAVHAALHTASPPIPNSGGNGEPSRR
jgi:uncharacterized protein (TIGR03086 family)